LNNIIHKNKIQSINSLIREMHIHILTLHAGHDSHIEESINLIINYTWFGPWDISTFSDYFIHKTNMSP